MRFTDVLLAFPAILLALGLGSVLRPSIPVVMLILTIITWPALARLVRSQVLTVRERAYVESARCAGAQRLPTSSFATSCRRLSASRLSGERCRSRRPS